jgi:hypothetical protein
MAPSRIICAVWLLAASAEAFAPFSLGAGAPRACAPRALRAESPRDVAQAAIAVYAGAPSKKDCRSFNRASFNRHFSRQGSNAAAAGGPMLRPQAAFMDQLAAVPLDLVDGGMTSAYGFDSEAPTMAAPAKDAKH